VSTYDPTVRSLAVETPESVSVRYRLAGLGSRGAAALIDTGLLILLLIAEALVATAASFTVLRLGGEDFIWLIPWIVGAMILVAFASLWGYFVIGEVSAGGRTPGKRIMGIRVVRDDGSRVGVLDSVIRNVVRIIDLLPGTYAIGIVSVLLSRDSKRLGDMAAGTVVIEDRGHELDGVPVAAEVEERVVLVREYLERRAGFTPEARVQVAAALLALWDEDPVEACWDEPTMAGRLADLSGLR
jgi:uncharacterized RDD family membrane protein YckC